MSKRIILKVNDINGRHVITIRRDSEWDEYTVQVHTGTELDGVGHYDTKDDALGTAEYLCYEINQALAVGKA